MSKRHLQIQVLTQATESRGWDFLVVPPPAGYCGPEVPPEAGKGQNAAVSEAMDGEVPLIAGKRREHAGLCLEWQIRFWTRVAGGIIQFTPFV